MELIDLLNKYFKYNDNLVISDYNNRIVITSKKENEHELFKNISTNIEIRNKIIEQIKLILSGCDLQYSSYSIEPKSLIIWYNQPKIIIFDDGIYSIIASYLDRHGLFTFIASHEHLMRLSKKSSFWSEMIKQRFPMYRIENFIKPEYNYKKLYLGLIDYTKLYLGIVDYTKNEKLFYIWLMYEHVSFFEYLVKNKLIILNMYKVINLLLDELNWTNRDVFNIQKDVLNPLRILLENKLLDYDNLLKLFIDTYVVEPEILRMLINYRNIIDGKHVQLSKNDIKEKLENQSLTFYNIDRDFRLLMSEYVRSNDEYI